MTSRQYHWVCERVRYYLRVKSWNVASAITQAQADALGDLIEANGKDRKKFLQWAKVEKIEDIPATTYAACIDAANFKASK